MRPPPTPACWSCWGWSRRSAHKFTAHLRRWTAMRPTQTFTLCGWWEYDEAIVANHILIPESRADAILTETGVVPRADHGRHDRDLEPGCDARKLRPTHSQATWTQILENHGYQAENSARGGLYRIPASTGATPARSCPASMDPTTFIAICAVLAADHLHRLPHHLQCVPDLRHQRHPLLRPAEDHRHHRPGSCGASSGMQALAAVPGGHPRWGWCWAGCIGGRLTPVIVRQAERGVQCGVNRTRSFLRPPALFSLVTVLLSCRKPGKMAARVSPIEAVRYTEGGNAETAKAKRRAKGVSLLLHGLGQPGPQPGQDGGHRPLSVPGGGAAHRDGHLHSGL